MEFEMEIPGLALIAIGTDINNRDPAQPAAAVRKAACSIGGAKRHCVGNGALGDDLSVLIKPADSFVQIQKLRSVDCARVQRCQSILNSGVIQRTASDSGGRIFPVHVDRMVEN